MDLKLYNSIRRFVFKNLLKSLHLRHLEDATQFVALEYFIGRTNLKWSLIKYLRQNGLSKRGKVCAITLEKSNFVGYEQGENEEERNNYFERHSFSNFKEVNIEDTIDIILKPLKLKSEVFLWAKTNYHQSIKKRSLSTLIRHLR